MRKLSLLLLCWFILDTAAAQQSDGYVNGLRKVAKGGKFGYVDSSGKVVVPYEYDDLDDFTDSKTPIRARKDRNWGYVDCKGEKVTGFGYYYACPFYGEKLALVCDMYYDANSRHSYYRYGYIDKNGNEVIECNEKSYKKAYPFSNGLAAVKKHKEKNFGFIDDNGEMVIKPKYSDVKWGFIDNYAWVKRNSKWGMIDKTEKTYVDFMYAEVRNFDPNTGSADAVTKEGVTHYFLKGKKFNTKKDRDETVKGQHDTPIPEPIKNNPPKIEWPIVPLSTEHQLFALNVQIKSDSKIDSCKLWFNDALVNLGYAEIKGATITASFDKQIVKTLTLRDGENTIKIKAWNAGGVAEGTRKITYLIPVKSQKAEIVWQSECPEKTIKEKMPVRIEIRSTCKVESCQLTVNGKPIDISSATKGITMVTDYDRQIVKDIHLANGKNTIKVTVKNAGGETMMTKEVRRYPCEKRIALVIGNDTYNNKELIYPFQSLPNCRRDADTIAQLLKKDCGFEVINMKDLKYAEMKKAIDDFIETIKREKYEVAFFYFSGHGVSLEKEKGDNYLIPINIGGCIENIREYPIEVKKHLLERLDKEAPNCNVRIAVLDCCRKNGLTQCGGPDIVKGTIESKGLVMIDSPIGSSILYGTAYDTYAYPGDKGYNSPFVESFVNCFRENPDANWSVFGSEVSIRVRELTKNYGYGAQQPVSDNRFFFDAHHFYLNPYHK